MRRTPVRNRTSVAIVHAAGASQRIQALGRAIGLGLSLLSLVLSRLLALCHGFAKRAHAFAQGLHRIGLLVDGLGQIAVPQRLFGTLHGAACPIQRIAGIAPFLAPKGQAVTLTFQLVPQGLLTLSQIPRAGIAIRARAALPRLALSRIAAATLLLAGLFATLTGTAGSIVALSTALTAVAALVALALTALCITVELFLQIAEGLIGEALLFAQGLGQTFHGLPPLIAALLALLAAALAALTPARKLSRLSPSHLLKVFANER